MGKNFSAEIIARILIAYEIENKHGSYGELAGRLGLKSGSVISGWSGRNRKVPDYIIAKVANDTGYSERWLRTGTGEPHDATASAEIGFPTIGVSGTAQQELDPEVMEAARDLQRLNGKRREQYLASPSV